MANGKTTADKLKIEFLKFDRKKRSRAGSIADDATGLHQPEQYTGQKAKRPR